MLHFVPFKLYIRVLLLNCDNGPELGTYVVTSLWVPTQWTLDNLFELSVISGTDNVAAALICRLIGTRDPANDK